jgi:hypothetical protein
MDEKLLLVKVITLLYRESHQRNRVDTSTDLVRTALENIALPSISTADNTYLDTIRALKSTALEMCNNPTDTIYDKTSLLQSLKLLCVGNDVIYNALEQGIEPDLEEKAINRTASTSATLATGSGSTNTTTYSMFYLANIAALTEAGTYAANLVYVATANF